MGTWIGQLDLLGRGEESFEGSQIIKDGNVDVDVCISPKAKVQ